MSELVSREDFYEKKPPLELKFSSPLHEMRIGNLLLPRENLEFSWLSEAEREGMGRIYTEVLQFPSFKVYHGDMIPIFPVGYGGINYLEKWRVWLLGPELILTLRDFKRNVSMHDVLLRMINNDESLDLGECPVRNFLIQQVMFRAVLRASNPSIVREFSNSSSIRGIAVLSDLGCFAFLCDPDNEEIGYTIYFPSLGQKEAFMDLLSQVQWYSPD